MDVSTGTPDGKWKPWVRWIALMAVIFCGAWTISRTQLGRDYAFLILVALAITIYRYRLSKQRVDLLIENFRVSLTLYMDIRNRIWVEWRSHTAAGKSCLGKSFNVPIWLDHEIGLGGQNYKLLIYAKRFPAGYMISNSGRGFQMTVLRNSFCF